MVRLLFYGTSQWHSAGDPLSPYLYIIASNILSCLLIYAKSSGNWNGIRIYQAAQPITHLFYGDDSLVFMKVNKRQFEIAQSIIDLFCSWLRQEINLANLL